DLRRRHELLVKRDRPLAAQERERALALLGGGGPELERVDPDVVDVRGQLGGEHGAPRDQTLADFRDYCDRPAPRVGRIGSAKVVIPNRSISALMPQFGYSLPAFERW